LRDQRDGAPEGHRESAPATQQGSQPEDDDDEELLSEKKERRERMGEIETRRSVISHHHHFKTTVKKTDTSNFHHQLYDPDSAQLQLLRPESLGRMHYMYLNDDPHVHHNSLGGGCADKVPFKVQRRKQNMKTYTRNETYANERHISRRHKREREIEE
jgi:hypothetical protein